jgi:hypothetical protein
MKKIYAVLVLAAFGLTLNLPHAQAQLSAQSIQTIGGVQADLPETIVTLAAGEAGLAQVAPADLPSGGTYYWILAGGSALPMPLPPQDGSAIYQVTPNIFITDQTGGQIITGPHRPGTQAANVSLASVAASQADSVMGLINQIQSQAATQQTRSMARAMGMGVPTPGDGGDGGSGDGGGSGDYTNNYVAYTFDHSLLWLGIVNSLNGWTYLTLNNGTNEIYAIWSTTNIATPFAVWNVAMEVWPTNPICMPFTVANLGRTDLFFKAEDWTGVMQNGLYCWWTWLYFGNLTESASDTDSQGNTLGDDYTNGIDPNVISFTLAVTNNYVNSMSAPVQLNITGGTPYYYAVTVDDPNYATDANWQNYAGTNLAVNLGITEGWHDVWIGLRGLPANATQTWQYKRLKLDYTPPALIITNPTNSSVTQPMIQLTGYSPEALGSLSYDLSNAVGVVTGQSVLILDQHYDTNTWEFTTNTFQAFDLPLTNGVNTITLHATDLAGNITTLVTNFTLNYSGVTNAPNVQILWPPAGTPIAGNSFTLRGVVDDPTATVTASVTDTNGVTTTFAALMERNGHFWLENLPLNSASVFTVSAANVAGHSASLSVTNQPASAVLTLTPVSPDSQLWQPTVSVYGTVSDESCSVTVNGMEAYYLDDAGDWEADNVPVTAGGVAIFDVVAYASSSTNAMPQQFNQDKPARLYVASYTVVMDTSTKISTDHYQDAFGNPTNSTVYGVQWDSFAETGTLTGSWQDGIGGSSSWNWDGIYSSSAVAIGTNYAWVDAYYPTSSYPNIVTEITNASDDDLGNPFNVTTEHCEIGVPVTDSSGTYLAPPGSLESAYDYQTEKDTASRHVEAKMQLQTGGKAGTGRLNLYCLNGTATQIPCVKWPLQLLLTGESPPATPVPPILPPSIALGGLGRLGSDGNLWLLLPDGTNLDVTPTVAGVDYYTFTETPTEYKMTVTANDTPLDPVAINVTNCVGQKVVFKLAFNPPLPDGVLITNQNNWVLPGKYVNATKWFQADFPPDGGGNYNITTCDPVTTWTDSGGSGDEPYCTTYVQTGWPLAQPETGAWWVSGGPKAVTCFPNLTFKNGQKASFSKHGNFYVLKPFITRIDTNGAFPGPYNGVVQWPYLWLNGGPMDFTVYISKTYPGKFGITQLVKMYSESAINWSSTYGTFYLDKNQEFYQDEKDVTNLVSYPSNDEYPVGSRIYDSPGQPLILGEASYTGHWQDYVRFTPTGDGSIPITLGRIDWAWSAVALENPSWNMTTNHVDVPTLHADDSFPVWTQGYPDGD